VPGLKTSAYLSLKLYHPDFEAVVMPFDKIIEAVKNEVVEAGLLIHEGQLFFPAARPAQVVVPWHLVAGTDQSSFAARRQTPSAARSARIWAA